MQSRLVRCSMGALLTACLHQEQLMATISLLWKANFCWKPCRGKDKRLREFPCSFLPSNRTFPPPRETLTKRVCLQLEPSGSLSDSLNHHYSTREATALCRGVPIAQGKHVRKTVPSRIDWAQGENNSVWEALM